MAIRLGVRAHTLVGRSYPYRNMAFSLGETVRRLSTNAAHKKRERPIPTGDRHPTNTWQTITPTKARPTRSTRPTHFLCFPLVTSQSLPQLASSLEAFRTSTTASLFKDSSKVHIIPAAAHRPAGTFHLTLTLPTTADLERAGQILASLNLDSLGLSQPIYTFLEGLGAFPNARNARVIYAPPRDPRGVLLHAGERVRDAFLDNGIGNGEERGLTLHATLANMRYVTPKGGYRHGRIGKDTPRVDARRLVEVYNELGGITEKSNDASQGEDGVRAGKYVLADGIVIDRLAICKMGAVPSADPILGATYPPIFERLFTDPPRPRPEVDDKQ